MCGPATVHPNRTPQFVHSVIFDGVKMTHIPRFTDKKTFGTVTMRGCIKIDESGKTIGKWSDKT